MKYISLFSGIGGLEAATSSPLYFCESDPACAVVLSRVNQNIPIVPDISSVPRSRADVCVAGWPCQDLTVAGRQTGIRGPHSSLFFKMLEVASRSAVHTIVAENVPNLIRIRKGNEFRTVIKSLADAGFPFIAWRSLNAREFGLPQDRERVIMVASKRRAAALALHRELPEAVRFRDMNAQMASGFYWTGGIRSICYSEGYVPALKVGASPPKGGTSPVAVFYNEKVRKLSPVESVRLQGFDPKLFLGLKAGDVFRMAGNAVPRGMGVFAVQSASFPEVPDIELKVARGFARNGLIDREDIYSIDHASMIGAKNLTDFLDEASDDSLSGQAAAGLLVRLISSGKTIPLKLFDALYGLSLNRSKLRGTTVNSFKILHETLKPLGYRRALIAAEKNNLRSGPLQGVNRRAKVGGA